MNFSDYRHMKPRIRSIGYKVVEGLLNKFGLHLTRYHPIFDLSKPAFIENIFGHSMYQNVFDIGIDYSGLEGLPIKYFRDQRDEITFIVNEIKSGYTVIDIGANIGFITLLLAKLVNSEGTVFAFEPGPVSFSLLKINVRINGYSNITLLNKAVSSASGTEKLFINPSGESDNQISHIALNFDEDRESIPIECVSLDDYFCNQKRKIDYIKMDIQGGEYKALQGMQNLLGRNKGIKLTIEYSPYLPLMADVDQLAYLDFIRSFGFRIFDFNKSIYEEVSNQYLVDTYNKDKVGKWTTLLLQR